MYKLTRDALIDKLTEYFDEAKEKCWGYSVIRFDLNQLLSDYEESVHEEGDVEQLKDKIADLECELSDKDDEIDELREKIDELKDKIEDLEEQLDEANEQLTMLGGEIIC